MDLDGYILRHGGQRDRLAELIRRRGDPSGEQADELVDLYQRVATHLSQAREISDVEEELDAAVRTEAA